MGIPIKSLKTVVSSGNISDPYAPAQTVKHLPGHPVDVNRDLQVQSCLVFCLRFLLQRSP